MDGVELLKMARSVYLAHFSHHLVYDTNGASPTGGSTADIVPGSGSSPIAMAVDG